MKRREEDMAKLKGMHHKKLESVQLDVSERLWVCVGVYVWVYMWVVWVGVL